MRHALARRHIGKVIRAYRSHPYHGRRRLPQEEVAGWAGMGQAQLSRIENGAPLLRLDQLIFWARLLSIPEDVLWFTFPAGEAPNSAVAARTSATTRPPSFAALLDGITPTPVPDRVGHLEIEQIRNAATHFEGWDFAYGSGLIRAAVVSQLRWASALLDLPCDRADRPELFAAVGYLAHTCAFMAFDDLANHDAGRMWRLALACAEEAADWPLRATVLSAMARRANWAGDYDEGMTHSELALVRSDRLSKPEQAKLHATKAHLLAATGNADAALKEIDTADTCFVDARATDVPPWMAYYDEAEHAGDTGHILARLATGGRPNGPAVERLTTAVEKHAPGFDRSRALCQTALASLTMATGDPVHAASLGHAALDYGDAVRSRRLDHLRRTLAGTTHPHAAIADVAELRHRLAAARHN